METPKQHVELINDNIKEFDKAIELFKQETLGEAATKLLWKKYPYHPPRDSGYWQDMFIEGAKWQQERSYSEEEVDNITQQLRLKLKSGVLKWQEDFEFDLEEWFEQFKKK